MRAEDFIARLDAQGLTGRGSQWQCPAHDDRNGSLSVTDGRDGLLLKCHAGCDWRAVIAAVGVQPADLFNGARIPNGNGSRPASTRRRRTTPPTDAEIDAWRRQAAARPADLLAACEARGWRVETLLALRVGFAVPPTKGHDGRPRLVLDARDRNDRRVGAVWYQPVPNGGKLPKSLAVGRRELWPPPERLPADAPLWIVEGEGDAITAREIGLPATAVPGCANWKADHADRFAGRDVIVCCDCDAPGRELADRIDADLAAHAAKVRVLDLDPARDDGYDLSDLLHEAGQAATRQRLDARIAAGTPTPDLAAVFDALRVYQHVPDADYVLVVLAAAATTDLRGDPLWVLLVANPSSGKTEAIRLLDDLAEPLDEITVAGLLGWIGTGAKGRPAGLLTRVATTALATIADLSTLLAGNNRGERDALYAALRRVYDGRFVREIGNVPQPLSWQGRLTLVGAVTPVVDDYASHADALGPRWLYARIPDLDGAGKRTAASLARANAGRLDGARRTARAAATHAVRLARRRIADATLPAELLDAIDGAAIAAALGRAAVPRSGYGARDVTGEVRREEPMRLVGQLSLLARGLLALGVDPGDARRIVVRCALDSIPQTRRKVLDELRHGEAALTAAALARRIGTDRKVVRLALEELQLIGLARFHGDEDDDDREDDEAKRRRKFWRIGDTERATVLAALEVGRKVGDHPPSPQIQGGTDGQTHGHGSHVSSHFDDDQAGAA